MTPEPDGAGARADTGVGPYESHKPPPDPVGGGPCTAPLVMEAVI